MLLFRKSSLWGRYKPRHDTKRDLLLFINSKFLNYKVSVTSMPHSRLFTFLENRYVPTLVLILGKAAWTNKLGLYPQKKLQVHSLLPILSPGQVWDLSEAIWIGLDNLIVFMNLCSGGRSTVVLFLKLVGIKISYICSIITKPILLTLTLKFVCFLKKKTSFAVILAVKEALSPPTAFEVLVWERLEWIYLILSSKNHNQFGASESFKVSKWHPILRLNHPWKFWFLCENLIIKFTSKNIQMNFKLYRIIDYTFDSIDIIKFFKWVSK